MPTEPEIPETVDSPEIPEIKKTPKPKSSADIVNQERVVDLKIGKLEKQLAEIHDAIATLRKPTNAGPVTASPDKGEGITFRGVFQTLGILH